MEFTSKKRVAPQEKGRAKVTKSQKLIRMQWKKVKQSKQKKKKEKKKDKVQKNKALDERDFNFFGQLFQLLVLKGRKLGINFDL